MEKGKVNPAPEQESLQEAAEEAVGESLVLKLSKPYVFEGRTYEELDLSGLENATAGDLAQAAKITSKKHRGLNPATLEMATEYAATIGHLMTKLKRYVWYIPAPPQDQPAGHGRSDSSVSARYPQRPDLPVQYSPPAVTRPGRPAPAAASRLRLTWHTPPMSV